MLTITSALRDCHRLRVQLRSLQAEIDRGPRILQEHQEELDSARNAHQGHFDAITKLKLKQREDEGTLKQTDLRLAKLEDQLTGLTAQKEYAAKQVEIAHTKEKKSQLEDAILTTINEIEERTTAIPAVEAKWRAAQAEFVQFEAEAAERLERLRSDMEVCRADLARAEEQLPPEVKVTYNTIVKAKGPDGFAAVKNRTCQACRANMTETQFSELRRGAFRPCPACGRIHYAVE
jgi:predicted  nucleic acid-binding Zn-ribbon protein